MSTFAIFRNSKEMERAILSLRHLGFRSKDISLLVPPHSDIGTTDLPYHERRQILTGARVGLIAGFLIWGFVSTLVALEVFPVQFVQTLSPIGKLMSVVIGAVCGALVGAGAGTLIGIGTPPPVGERYENYVNSGGILLSVHGDDQKDMGRVKELLEKMGGQDVHSLDEVRGWKPALVGAHF